MKILVLGDVMGVSGRKALRNNLNKIINENKIDFTIINGENAADDGRGITNLIAEEFFSNGVDVITSGNHIWDKKETIDYINQENRLLRPANLAEGSPGKGYEI
jgi:calcineurin-like phosphoesterase